MDRMLGIFVVVVPLGLAPARADRVGLDAIHGFDAEHNLALGANFETFREVIAGAGHELIPLTSFLPEDLQNLDAVFFTIAYDQNDDPFTRQERIALWNFVKGGGGLVAVADSGSGFRRYNFNQLVAPYGIIYDDPPSEGSGHVIRDFVPHPITEGLEEMGIDYQLRITTNSPSIDLTTGAGADNALSVLGDGGLAVFLSDSSMWSDPDAGSDYPITFGSNTLLLDNILAYVTAGRVCNGLVFIKRGQCRVIEGEVAKAIIVALNTSVGAEYTCELATGQARTVIAGNKARFVFKGANAPPLGPNTATVCNDSLDFSCTE